MLNVFRKMAASKPAKGLLLLVALTFVLWGVGDVTKGGSTTVITVGDKKISDREWHAYFSNALRQFEKMSGGKISNEEIKQNRVVEILADQIINKIVIEKEAEASGIFISDLMIAERLSVIPDFQTDGKFDKAKFLALLQQNQLNEEMFLNNMRASMMQEMLLTPLNSLSVVPLDFKKQVALAKSVEHKTLVAKIDMKGMKIDKEPIEEDLKLSYEIHKSAYALPDKRDITYATFTPADIKVDENVDEEILKDSYNKRLEYNNEPEKRLVDMMMFAEEEPAKAAHAEIVAGVAFKEIARKSFPDKKDFSMGYVTKEGFDKETIAAIFNTQAGQNSNVVKTPMGFAIFHVVNIKPEATKSYEDVKAQLKADYINELKFEQLTQIAQSLDSADAKSLAELVSKYGFAVHSMKGITSLDVKGSAVLSDDNFMQVAFKTDIGKISQPVPFVGSTDKFFILQVDASTGQGFASLESVKSKVRERWVLDQKKILLTQKVDAIEEKLKEKPADFKAFMSSELSAEVSPVSMRFDHKTGNYPEGLVNEVFSIAPSAVTGIYQSSTDHSIAYVAMLESIKLGAASEDSKLLDFELPRVIANEVTSAYVGSLRKKYDVSFSKDLAEKIVGIE